MIHGAFCGPWAFDKFRQPFEDAGYKVHTPALRLHEQGARVSSKLGSTSLIDYAHATRWGKRPLSRQAAELACEQPAGR